MRVIRLEVRFDQSRLTDTELADLFERYLRVQVTGRSTSVALLSYGVRTPESGPDQGAG